jgi:hypothetical protein
MCCTAYLFAEEEEPLPEPLQAAFSGVNGRNILDMLVTVSQHSLVAFQGETELHRQVSRLIWCFWVADVAVVAGDLSLPAGGIPTCTRPMTIK